MSGRDPIVRNFRQILLWPFQVVASRDGESVMQQWDALERAGAHAWKEVDDEFTGDPRLFQERHYHEFVSFLPYVQRFLYGDELGERRAAGYGESPMRVFRRGDVARMRVQFTDDTAPIELDVAHVDLYLFTDLDIAILVVEIFAADLTLAQAQEALFRIGRAYPSFWAKNGHAGNCPRKVEWLAASGQVLATSDYDLREEYLAYVCEHRAPRLASHWEYLVQPISARPVAAAGALRLRQLEYYRMPVMAFLAVDDPDALTRAQFVRLAFATEPGSADELPYSARHLRRFERDYCYDREWRPDSPSGAGESIRFLCCGHAFVTIGPARRQYFIDAETGVLGQFRHELFLIGLIAHFHKSALLMLSERLIVAISRLDFTDKHSVRSFRRSIRASLETFLRFTHRYWFHEVSDQARVRELFRMWTGHLGTDRLFAEVREEIQDMNHYLEAGSARRQTNTMMRLTVVTTFGLIGTVATGFLGMNLIAAADEPLAAKIAYFLIVLIPTIALTLLTVARSERLAEFLDVLSDERESPDAKLTAFRGIWRSRGARGPVPWPSPARLPALTARPRIADR
ncbi:MAG: hypothetical protein ACKVQU_06755 [Burkholderiales bacterium]